MKLAIMQPYFLPYLGYFQLINAVDKFVIYDDIQFTKKGWMNRNQILVNGKSDVFTINVQKASTYLPVVERIISPVYAKERDKTLSKIKQSYKNAPYYSDVYPLLEEIFKCNDVNLFSYIYNSVVKVCKYLGIETEIVISSTLGLDENIKSQDRVLATCKYMRASVYINPEGGVDLYDKSVFLSNDVELGFLTMDPITYSQGSNDFIPYLSIVDVMMWNSKGEVLELLDCYEIK